MGIDGAAHAGATEVDGAPPVAVVGSGLDVVYPRRHRSLWQLVAERGVVLSEHPLGSAPVAWHFPARNRLIAALADVVVVVESQERGGSMHTVDEAQRRDVDVMAVPGPVTSRASTGTNRLLADGAEVARDATDVLVKLGLGSGSRRATVERRPAPHRARPGGPRCVRLAAGGPRSAGAANRLGDRRPRRRARPPRAGRVGRAAWGLVRAPGRGGRGVRARRRLSTSDPTGRAPRGPTDQRLRTRRSGPPGRVPRLGCRPIRRSPRWGGPSARCRTRTRTGRGGRPPWAWVVRRNRSGG